MVAVGAQENKTQCHTCIVAGSHSAECHTLLQDHNAQTIWQSDKTQCHTLLQDHSAQTIWQYDKTQCHRLRTLRNRPRVATVIAIDLKSVCRASIFQHQDYDINKDNKGILPLFCSDMSLSATVPTMVIF